MFTHSVQSLILFCTSRTGLFILSHIPVQHLLYCCIFSRGLGALLQTIVKGLIYFTDFPAWWSRTSGEERNNQHGHYTTWRLIVDDVLRTEIKFRLTYFTSSMDTCNSQRPLSITISFNPLARHPIPQTLCEWLSCVFLNSFDQKRNKRNLYMVIGIIKYIIKLMFCLFIHTVMISSWLLLLIGPLRTNFSYIPWICYERGFGEFYLFIWNQLVFNQRLQLFVQSPQPYLLIFARRN